MPKNIKLGLVLASVFLLAAGCGSPATNNENINANTQNPPASTDNQNAGQTAEPKTFTVNGNNFVFDVKEIRVKQGDRVRIVFNNTEGFHDWVLDEFKAKTKQLTAGQSETIEFVADKTGTFEYYCSVGKHREMGMKGNLIVE